jgi:phosphoribosylformylglycinamidine (FGAM) synthase-like amidotransferase family enzyme
MYRTVRAMVLTGNGINCEMETAFACRLAGADEVTLVSLWDWAAGKVSLSRFNLICFPGGFLDGDDLGGARACATRIKHTRSPASGRLLVEELAAFVREGKLIMGICNGFQLLVKLGLLPSAAQIGDAAPSESAWRQRATLTFNTIGRFEDRWVTLKADPDSPCIFTRGIDTVALPVRHGEGRLIIDESAEDAIRESHQIPLRYADPVNFQATETYPFNPNGSRFGAAALCDDSGRILGMMPHPECYWNPLNHTDWSRSKETGPDHGEGLIFFKNAVQYLKEMS